MNLEHNAVFCEEIGQQLLSYGKQKTPEQCALEIDAITKEDVMKSVEELLNYPIAYSVFGKDVQKELKSLPHVDGIYSYLRMSYKLIVCCLEESSLIRDLKGDFLTMFSRANVEQTQHKTKRTMDSST